MVEIINHIKPMKEFLKNICCNRVKNKNNELVGKLNGRIRFLTIWRNIFLYQIG